MAKRGRPRHPDVLTPREWEVLSLLREGLTNEQIAERLGVTLHAARYHVSEILSKLGVATREEAAAWQPEEIRAGPRWSVAFQVWLTAAAAVAVLAVGVLAWGVARGSDDDAPTSSRTPSQPTATQPRASATAEPTSTFFPFPRPDLGANVRSMQLVSEDAGFVLTDDALIRIPFIPAGEKIDVAEVDITPPGIGASNIKGFHFLDSDHGWVVSDGDIELGSQIEQLLAFRTTDGGDSWQSSPLTGPANIYLVTRLLPAYIDFVDANRGWVALSTQQTMNSPTGELYRTDDGGETWTQLSTPVGREFHFVDANTGWTVGGVLYDTLYVTRDGGETWADASDITPLAQPAGPRTFGLPVAVDDGRLLLPVRMYIQGHSSLLMVYSSTDGGQVWPQVTLTEIGEAISEGSPLAAFIFPTGAVVAVAPDGNGYRLSAGATEFEAFTPTQTGDFRNPSSETGLFMPAALNFIDEQRGWGIAFAGGCDTFKADCWDATFIQQTEDGGLTWSPLPFGSAPTQTP
jgi:DNA-binding CsgD family transcriptional regulator